MLHTQIIMLGPAPDNSNHSLHLPRKSLCCTGSRQFKHFLMPVQASNNSHANPDACAEFVTPVQASNNSNVNPDACEGSQQFKQFLMPVQASNNSHANPSACEGSRQFKQFNK
ncbi:hypothetical protein O181_073811 [Austropuccinia psidii MF-1]|uniref:Uncharacterized protein n=1 Tax=Austropuccinia psidii MF-1 TaxID=1389203 RepID=A0A9Q3FBV9_9BASI|nr:hypothetical protein [Austropuccinia psidii MF-1]